MDSEVIPGFESAATQDKRTVVDIRKRAAYFIRSNVAFSEQSPSVADRQQHDRDYDFEFLNLSCGAL
jgi:hypothetical protein